MFVKKKCLRKHTQSFRNVHETSIPKRAVKYIRKNIYTSKKTHNTFIHDNRLDIIITNLAIDYNSTKIIEVQDVSDHSAVVSQIKWRIDESKITNKYNPRGTRKK